MKKAEDTSTYTVQPTARSVFSASPENNATPPQQQIPTQPQSGITVTTINLDRKSEAKDN